MLAQLFFPFLLYVIGLLPGLFLRRKVPLAFFAWTAFGWGAFSWALTSAILLWLPVAYSTARVALLLGLVMTAAAVAFRQHLELPARHELRTVALSAIVFVALVGAMAYLRFVEISTDSLYQLVLADKWASGRFEDSVLSEFGYWGHVLPALHAAAPALGADYYYTLAPATGITLLGTFRYFCEVGLRQLPQPIGLDRLAAIVATLFLASSLFLLFQFFYFHNNLLAGLYLLIATGSLWLAHIHSSPAYLTLSILAFLAYGMTRTETALYAIVFLAPALSLRQFSRRTWLRVLFPFTVYLGAWNVLLLLFVRPDTHIMSPARLLVMIGAVTGVYVVAVLAEAAPFRIRLTPFLHRLMLLFLAAVILMLVFLEPLHLPRTAIIFFVNLVAPGFLWWGMVWWVAIALGIFAVPHSPQVPFERLFATGIVGFIFVLIIVSFEHPFRVGFGDSGNRTFTALLPVVALYLTLKTAPYLLGEQLESHREAVEPDTASV